MAPAHPEDKLAELLLYIAERLTDEPAAGSTKVNKLLYFAEQAHLRATGQPITGVDYQRLPNGPAPRQLLPVRERLIAQGDAELRREPYLGKMQDRLVASRPADTSVLSSTERSAVDEVLHAYGSRSGGELSDISHRDPGWLMSDNGETIPLEAAFLRSIPVTPRIRSRADELALELGIVER